MSQNKSTMTKCGKKTKVHRPQNGFCPGNNYNLCDLNRKKKFRTKQGKFIISNPVYQIIRVLQLLSPEISNRFFTEILKTVMILQCFTKIVNQVVKEDECTRSLLPGFNPCKNTTTINMK